MQKPQTQAHPYWQLQTYQWKDSRSQFTYSCRRKEADSFMPPHVGGYSFNPMGNPRLITLPAIYAPDSSGKTFTSTRRFFLLCSALLGSVQFGSGLSQPFPTTLNLFGSNLYLSMIERRTASARS